MKAENGIIIGPNTKVKILLDANQAPVIEALVKLNKNFSKLRSPILRNLFARRVTIAEACKIANCKIDDFLKSMAKIGFKANFSRADVLPTDVLLSNYQATTPSIDFTRKATVVELDVRPYLENDQDPLRVIQKSIKQLAEGDRLKLINKFEATPLIVLLESQGYLHQVDFIADDYVVTWFEKNTMGFCATALPENTTEPEEIDAFNAVKNRFSANKIKYIDVRYLEMPAPMLLILEHIDSMSEDQLLYIYHKKVPLFLLTELEESGFAYHFNFHSNTGVDMLIYRK